MWNTHKMKECKKAFVINKKIVKNFLEVEALFWTFGIDNIAMLSWR